jgi:hypothetical protein
LRSVVWVVGRCPVIIPISAPWNVRHGGLPAATAGSAVSPLSGSGGDSGSLCGTVFVQLGGTDNDPREPALSESADGTSALDTARNDPNA